MCQCFSGALINPACIDHTCEMLTRNYYRLTCKIAVDDSWAQVVVIGHQVDAAGLEADSQSITPLGCNNNKSRENIFRYREIILILMVSLSIIIEIISSV